MRNHIRSLLIFVLLLFNSYLSAQPGWERIHAGISEPLHDIEFINDSTGFIYSYGTGNIYRTEDDGLSWKLYLQTDSIYYEQIQFVESTGWICGEYGKILKTTDSGISWEDVSIKSENNLLLYGMHFRNSLSGIVTGAEIIERKFSPRIFITGDGGNTWVEEMADFPYMILNLTEKDDLLFASGTGYISTINIEKSSYKHIFKDTLKLIGQIRDIEFSDAKFGMGCSFNGYILTTVDGGETFTYKQITNNRLRSIVYIGGQKWLAAGDNNKDDGAVIYTSNDNGISWEKNNDFPDIHRIYIIDNTIWIVGKAGLIAKREMKR